MPKISGDLLWPVHAIAGAGGCDFGIRCIANYGESGGEPRDPENPADRVQDIRSGRRIPKSNLPGVARQRVGALVICAGGGYTLNEAARGTDGPRCVALRSV